MGRRKSLITKTPEEIIVEGIAKRITSLDQARKQYALKYVSTNPKWGGWLAFMVEKLVKIKDELMRLDPEERAKRVWNLIREAKKEWRELPEEAKMEYIRRGRAFFEQYKRLLESLVKEAKEYEKIAEEVEKMVEALV